MTNENPNARPNGNNRISSLLAVLFAPFIRFRYIFAFVGPIRRLAIPKNRWLLVIIFGVCTLIYYFGELIDLIVPGAIHWRFLDEVHDIHRLLFIAPIIYACYFFGVKAMVIVNVASLIVFLPRAIFISPFPDAIARSLIFVAFAGVLCYLVRISRNKIKRFFPVYTMTANKRNSNMGLQKKIEDEIFVAGDLEVDFSRRLVRRNGQIVRLTVKEYNLLAYLVRNCDKPLRHGEILKNVWGVEYGQEKEYLRTFVRQLRTKIEDDPSKPRLIVTELGFGYRFVQPK